MIYRPRRLRSSGIMRDLTAETFIVPAKLIMPYFVCEGKNIRTPIGAMPEIDNVSVDNLLRDIESDAELGIKSILMFGIPDYKDDIGSGAYADDGIVQKAVREIKKRFPELMIITDICLCEYTSHGHCGVVENGIVLNDPTLELLAKTALSHARAGADMAAPSDMMDGRVGALRDALDSAGFHDMPIMAYSAKYASAFYGPFREAAGSAPQFGSRKAYQMDPRNGREAEREVMLDLDEGADIVMVKPALSYLDIIYRIKEISPVPLCAYNVSGEYSMVKAAGKLGMVDEERVIQEILTSIFRAGADMVISYHTREVLKKKLV
ncbi:MAG: porphobilinogen synthase [Spirochaetia bacterium]|jgi:porphobilinogen synthase|nr:porphobilinogen synthase [Spirochaetia bacterium]